MTWCCQLEPDYCFTTDGHNESRFADSLLAGIKRLDRHPAVLGWTRMWANHLGSPPDLFSLGRPVLFGALHTVTVSRGIDDRWWGPTPADAAPDMDQDHSPAHDALAVAELAAADIDTDDLLALLTDASTEPTPVIGRQSAKRRRQRGSASRPDGKKSAGAS